MEKDPYSYCLHPKTRHRNKTYALRCKECDFFVKGARIENYEITKFLGRGGFGDVYEVLEPPPLGRTFALKVLRVDKSQDPLFNKFSEEATSIAKLQHPNILPVYKYGNLENNRPYFIMEHATGTLKQYFQNPDGSPQLAFAEGLVPFVEQAAQALDFIHRNGYIHQDIKPINLLVKNEQLFLADFGTSYYLGIKTHSTQIASMGTYRYMSPEHLLELKPRRESDQYALAVSFYELLTGHTPFEYLRVEQMLLAIKSEEPPPPQKWNPRVPVEVVAVLLRAMAKDFHQRYPSVLAFAEAYKDAVSLALQRYVCQKCGHQNRSGAQRCRTCGTVEENRTCPYCDTYIRLGQRCCTHCGRLTITPDMEEYSAFNGLSINKGRYVIKRVLKNTPETKVLVAVAQDTHTNGQLVVLKRRPCTDIVKDTRRYESVSDPLINLRHPLVPRILDHFVEGQNYYHVQTYMDGESIEERLQKLLGPLPERKVIHYINIILNILIALEQQLPPNSYHFCSLTPTNIILDNIRDRAFLTGFQLPYRATRKLNLAMAFSPYLPLEGGSHDQRTLIYSLAACAYYALSKIEPPIGKPPIPISTLNAKVSPAFQFILDQALQEHSRDRYQSYREMQEDIKKLL